MLAWVTQWAKTDDWRCSIRWAHITELDTQGDKRRHEVKRRYECSLGAMCTHARTFILAYACTGMRVVAFPIPIVIITQAKIHLHNIYAEINPSLGTRVTTSQRNAKDKFLLWSASSNGKIWFNDRFSDQKCMHFKVLNTSSYAVNNSSTFDSACLNTYFNILFEHSCQSNRTNTPPCANEQTTNGLSGF